MDKKLFLTETPILVAVWRLALLGVVAAKSCGRRHRALAARGRHGPPVRPGRRSSSRTLLAPFPLLLGPGALPRCLHHPEPLCLSPWEA